MAVLRQVNFLGQQRVDVPHLRSLESGVAADFDVLAGQMVAGDRALVMKGFELISTGISQAAQLKVEVAGSLIVHPRATEAGSIFQVPDDRADETLSATNSRVTGAFAASTVNYVGVDLVRAADDATADLAMFLDANTLVESSKTTPLGRTLDYRLVISTLDFSATPGLCPLAKVITDASNNIVSVEDARDMMFRLGAGGGQPDPLHAFGWPGGRLDTGLTGGDKSIGSLKDWCDSIMTRLWELGGGERWFSPASDRNIKLAQTGSTFANGEYFEWDGTHLHWQGLVFLFDNSTATFNDIANQTGNSTGLTDLADGECIYVDVDRTTNRTGGTALVAVKAPLATIGVPEIPGSRFVLAWRKGSQVIPRDQHLPVGSGGNSFATTSSNGLVRLAGTPGAPTTPYVANLDASFRAIAAGLTRDGSATVGAGALAIGTTASDTNITYGHAASTGHALTAASGPGSVGVIDASNETELNSFLSTIVGRFRQKHGGVMKDVVRVMGDGAIVLRKNLRGGAWTGMASDEGTLAIADNGLSSPNHRMQLVVIWPNGTKGVILESDAD